MMRPANVAISAVALALISACAAGPKLTVRPQANALAEGAMSAAYRVAEARSYYLMGSIGLASEGFRRALREDPTSVDALNGLAACYDRLGRFDLSRSYYEKALALAPSDGRLYANLATSLTLQGRAAEAAAVRAELAARLGKAAPVSVALSAPTPVSPPVATSAADTETSHPSASVRLERVSLAEVMLVTEPEAVASTAPRSYFIPAPKAKASPSVVVLNAAKVQHLAASTAVRLRHLGWEHVVIGDAPAVLPVSRITYPAHRGDEAKRVARELRIDLRQPLIGKGDKVVVLLGRDLAGRKPGA